MTVCTGYLDQAAQKTAVTPAVTDCILFEDFRRWVHGLNAPWPKARGNREPIFLSDIARPGRAVRRSTGGTEAGPPALAIVLS